MQCTHATKYNKVKYSGIFYAWCALLNFRSKLSKLNKDAKRMVCDCSTSIQERSLGIVACGDDCLNRLLMIECGMNCNCEEYCTNKNFKNKNNAPIVPFKTELKGLGLKTKTELKPY